MNKNPKTAQIQAYQWQKHDRDLGKVIGTRYPIEVEAALLAMDAVQRQEYIRGVVEGSLMRDGLI